MNGHIISAQLKETIMTKGLSADAEGMRSVNDPTKCERLGEAVWAKMQIMGETDDTKVVAAISLYADVLCRRWHGIGTMSDRIINRYYASNPAPARDAEEGRGQDGQPDDERDEGQGDGEGQGDQDDPDQEDEEQGKGRGEGDPGRDNGGQPRGDSGAEGQGSGEDQSRGQGGRGSGSGADGQGEDGDEDNPGSGSGAGDGDEEGEEGGEGVPGRVPSGDGEEQEGEGEEGEGAGQAPPEDDGDEEQFEFDDDWMPPENFNKIVEAVRMGKNVALYGPAGCGKTDIATHVGMALELQYYITTAPQMPYDLTGFVDATGTYTETAFSVPFMRGGIAVLDELDRSSPEAVIAVNAPIANGTMFVPKVGQFTKHKDCIFMATLNTVGLGADDEYVTANQLDASTRDRFIWFPVDYDERVELKVARGDRALVSFAQDWREACAKVGVTNALFSYRVIKDFKDLCENRRFGVMEAIETTLLKGGVPKSTCLMIQKCFQRNNKYHKAFKMYVEQMKEE